MSLIILIVSIVVSLAGVSVAVWSFINTRSKSYEQFVKDRANLSVQLLKLKKELKPIKE